MMNCGGNYCGKNTRLFHSLFSPLSTSALIGTVTEVSCRPQPSFLSSVSLTKDICSHKPSWLKMHRPSPKTLIPVLQPYWPNRSCTSQLAFIAAQRPFWLRHDEVLPKMLEKQLTLMLAQLVPFICRGAQMKLLWPAALQFVSFLL